jgi:hypothetical protein
MFPFEETLLADPSVNLDSKILNKIYKTDAWGQIQDKTIKIIDTIWRKDSKFEINEVFIFI